MRWRCRPMRRRRCIHKKLPTQPAALEPFLAEVETVCAGRLHECAAAGKSSCRRRRSRRWRRSCMNYTGLPVELFDAGESAGGRRGCSRRIWSWTRTLTTGRLDTRYKGPDLDPLSESGGLRSAEQCDLCGVYGGDQQLSAQGSEVWRRRRRISRARTARRRVHVGLAASVSGMGRRRWTQLYGGGTERDAGPGVSR